MKKVAKGEIKAVISDFEVDSIMLVMQRCKKSWRETRKFLLSLMRYNGLEIYSLTMLDKIRATKHVKNFGLDLEDSLVLQGALSNGIKEIVSLDPDFDNVKIIKRLKPSDMPQEHDNSE